MVLVLIMLPDPPFGEDEKRICLWIVYSLLGMVMVELLVRLRTGLWPVRLFYVIFVPMIVFLLMALYEVDAQPVRWFMEWLEGFWFLLPFSVLMWGIILPCYHYLIGKGGRPHPLSGSRELQAVLLLAFILVIAMPFVLYATPYEF